MNSSIAKESDFVEINSNIVAYVGDEVITEYDLETFAILFKNINRINIPIDKNFKSYVLKDMIKRMVVVGYFRSIIEKTIKKNKSMQKNLLIEVSDEEVESVYQQIAKDVKTINTKELVNTKKLLKEYLLLNKMQQLIIAPEVKISQKEIDDYIKRRYIENNKKNRESVHLELINLEIEKKSLKIYNKAVNHIAVEINY